MPRGENFHRERLIPPCVKFHSIVLQSALELIIAQRVLHDNTLEHDNTVGWKLLLQQQECQSLVLPGHSEIELVVNRICEGLWKGVWMKSSKSAGPCLSDRGKAEPPVSDSMAELCGHPGRMLTCMVIAWRMGVCPSHRGPAWEVAALRR